MIKSFTLAVLGIVGIAIIAGSGYFIYKQYNGTKPVGNSNSSVDYWQMFSKITKERRFVEEAEAYYRIPIFTSELLTLAGTEVSLSGYYLPYSRLDSVIIISRFPNASCFFCGQAGVESVAMVELNKNTPKYRTDQRLKVHGRLMLNSSNINKLAFVIKNARVEEL